MTAREVVGAGRALLVTFGPTVAVDIAAAASVKGALRRRPRPRWAVAGTALTALYLVAGRPWMRRHDSVDIDAPPEAVWPWLAQIGQDRGGFYSIEWLENLAGCRMRNADLIHSEWQHREVGEKVMLHPLNGLPVSRFEPGRALGMEGWGTFELESLPGDRTRLVERGHEVGAAGRVFAIALVELPHFVMQQAMFRGLRRRAERVYQEGLERRSASSSAAAFAAASSALRSLAS